MAENENVEKVEMTAQAAEAPAAPAKKDKAEKKPEKKKKPGIFARIKGWWKDTKSELKKVQWPTAKQTVNNTVIVIICVIIVGIFIWLFDFVAGGLIQALIGLVS